MEQEAPTAAPSFAALPSPLGLFATLDEYSLRHLIMSFLDGVDLVRLAACRRVFWAWVTRPVATRVRCVATRDALTPLAQLGYAHNVL